MRIRQGQASMFDSLYRLLPNQQPPNRVHSSRFFLVIFIVIRTFAQVQRTMIILTILKVIMMENDKDFGLLHYFIIGNLLTGEIYSQRKRIQKHRD